MTFDTLAATCAEYLSKGREVAVVGRLRLKEWTSREGERRSRIQVAAEAVQFLDSPKKTADPEAGGVQALGRHGGRIAGRLGDDHAVSAGLPQRLAQP